MKIFTRLFLLLMSCTGGHSYAQNNQEANESVFRKVKGYVNARNDDSLYALLNDDFKARFDKAKFSGILKNNLYPMGAIEKTTLISYGEGVSNYKTVCAKAVIEFRIGTDKTGKIYTLQFLEYKEPAATKNYVVATDNPMRSALDSQVDKIAGNYINKVSTVGLSIGILKKGVTTIYGYGETAKGNNHVPGPDAEFEIASITKTFTGTLLAYYVLEHKISLSDPITKYLPDSVAANRNLQQITVQMLSNHTSGLARIPDNMLDADMLNPYKNYNRQKLFTYLKNGTLQSVPGEKYAYSNLGAGLLGTILEGISGRSYEQMVTDIICRPSGMANTYQHPDAKQKVRQVSVYNEKGEPVIMWETDALAGAGALRSCTHDLLLYSEGNMKKDGSRLSGAMELTHHITYDKEMSIGLGWHKAEVAGMDCYWHNGGTAGSSSYIGFVPAHNIAVVVLSNAAERADAVAEGILKILK